MENYCPYTDGNVVYLQCKECEEKLCEKDRFFCGFAGTPLSIMKSRKKMAALAAMCASERGYSFIPVTNDDLPTYLSKQQQKGCVVFEGVADEREIENTCRELRIPLRHCRLEGA